MQTGPAHDEPRLLEAWRRFPLRNWMQALCPECRRWQPLVNLGVRREATTVMFDCSWCGKPVMRIFLGPGEAQVEVTAGG